MRCVLALLLSAGLLCAAPAPLPRPAGKAHWLVGRWTMHWGGAAYRVEFRPDGSYLCHLPGGTEPFYGDAWRVEGRRVTVYERPLAQDVAYSYSFEPGEGMEAVIDGGNCQGVRVRLERR